MNLHRSKIEWCTHTWNPVTGCLHGCTYCYARRFIDRFKPQPYEYPQPDALEFLPHGSGIFVSNSPCNAVNDIQNRMRTTLYPRGFAPTFHTYTLCYPAKRSIPSRVFVSSLGDLFGEWVPDIWIQDVFDACEQAPQHTYLFLTKNPQRYCDLAEAGKLPARDNFWYGSTVTNDDKPIFFSDKHNCYVSIEPLLGPFDVEVASVLENIRWVIIGAMTGPGCKQHQPKREWIENIVESAELSHAAVFMKDSLAPIWGPDLIREHPEGMVWPEDNRRRKED